MDTDSKKTLLMPKNTRTVEEGNFFKKLFLRSLNAKIDLDYKVAAVTAAWMIKGSNAISSSSFIFFS